MFLPATFNRTAGRPLLTLEKTNKTFSLLLGKGGCSELTPTHSPRHQLKVHFHLCNQKKALPRMIA